MDGRSTGVNSSEARDLPPGRTRRLTIFALNSMKFRQPQQRRCKFDLRKEPQIGIGNRFEVNDSAMPELLPRFIEDTPEAAG